MNTKMGPIIKTILNMLDDETIKDYKMFLSLLDDLAPEQRTERKVFRRVITQETLSFLLELNDSSDPKSDLLKTKKRLEDEYGLSESWSVLIVSSFADAFGIPSDILNRKEDEKNVTDIQGFQENTSTVNAAVELIRKRERLLKEKNELGFFSSKRKSEIDKQIAEIDALCMQINLVSKEAKGSDQVKNNPAPIQTNQITKIEVFSSDGTIDGKKMFGTTFLKGETSYIGVKVCFAKNVNNKNIDLSWRIYNENGTPFTSDIETAIPVGPQNDRVLQQWGWKSVGHWSVGKYKIVASINRGAPVSIWFEIKDGKYDVFPYRLKGVKLFNDGTTAQPMDQRVYTNVFSRSLARYIYFQLEFPQPGRNLSTTIDYSITDENGRYVVNATTQIDIKSNYVYCWVGYGWNTAGNWAPGKYTYSVALGKSPALTGRFEIRN